MNRRSLLVALATFLAAVSVAVVLAAPWHGRPTSHPVAARPTPTASVSASPSPTPVPSPSPTPWVSGQPLPRTLQAGLDLHAAAAGIPLRFAAPTVGINTGVLGVGLTSSNAVDAPKGPASSPVWDEAFWYRGGAEPGQPGVFAVAGHVDRVGGAPAAFAPLKRIHVGDVVTVTDQRSGAVYRYRISETEDYDVRRINTADILARLYGPDVAKGVPPSVPADGVARISIITCDGTWLGAQYDHRFVAYGELIPAA